MLLSRLFKNSGEKASRVIFDFIVIDTKTVAELSQNEPFLIKP